MAPRERDDDEMDLINAEFESMVADLNLDQSAPTTFVDELDAIDKSENSAIYYPPHVHRGVRGAFEDFIATIRRWWKSSGDDDTDGAVV